jgi:hypothetical protein
MIFDDDQGPKENSLDRKSVWSFITSISKKDLEGIERAKLILKEKQVRERYVYSRLVLHL